MKHDETTTTMKMIARSVALTLTAALVFVSCASVRERGTATPSRVSTTNTAAADAHSAVRIPLVEQDGLPGASYAELTADGAWSWFGDPRAVYHEGQRRRTYVGWVTSSGDVVVAQYDHDTGEVSSSVVAQELQVDDHASPSILIREDGRLMVFYCGHRGRWMIYRISSNPEDATSWGREHAASGHTSEVWGYTYPCAFQLSGEAGKRYLFWRGRDYLPTFSTSETGMVWSDPKVLIDAAGEQPYVKYASDGTRSIHIAFTDDHPGNRADNSVHYARYADGAFYRADGTLIAPADSLPISPEEADLVYDAAAEGARAWLWDLAFDELGRPVIAFAVFPAEDDHRYRYVRWNGTVWTGVELTEAGRWFPSIEPRRRYFEPYYSGGMALDHSDPSTVYLSMPVAGVFEIERWTTSDEGASWSHATVTAGSAENNVRPLVPVSSSAGGPRLIWMYGPYMDYTRYGTGLRMK
ncbi:MAG: BNR-4 repeat-containing protein [Candidatus Eisenbacteria bacterium]|nr:BNR-4 repeat-containing protein [Candidatus Eisenbacteria bacterium]